MESLDPEIMERLTDAVNQLSGSMLDIKLFAPVIAGYANTIILLFILIVAILIFKKRGINEVQKKDKS